MFEGEYAFKEKRKGKEFNNGLLIFEGEYLNGERHGKGKEYYNKGKIRFEGEYINNIKEYYYNGQLIYEGKYLNGERNGKGKVYYEDGKLKFEGEYRSDIIWNGKGYDEKGIIIYELKNGGGYLK